MEKITVENIHKISDMLADIIINNGYVTSLIDVVRDILEYVPNLDLEFAARINALLKATKHFSNLSDKTLGKLYGLTLRQR